MWQCEFWDPKDYGNVNTRSCTLGPEDECPYPSGGCYEDNDTDEEGD